MKIKEFNKAKADPPPPFDAKAGLWPDKHKSAVAPGRDEQILGRLLIHLSVIKLA